MKKSKTNVSVVSNAGIRRNVNVHIGDNGSFPSGDILDANATKQLVDNVAVTGDYNDLENKPTIPNIAVVSIEMEDVDTSTNPFTITNQDKISQICDLIDAGTMVFGIISSGVNTPAICSVGGPSFAQATLYISGFTAQIQSDSPFGTYAIFGVADVSSRYVTSNTEP